MARDVLGGNGILLDHHVARHHANMEASTPTKAPTPSNR
jgi:alkylation response protein AidB-like acyl-CoA dehydrogenase